MKSFFFLIVMALLHPSIEGRADEVVSEKVEKATLQEKLNLIEGSVKLEAVADTANGKTANMLLRSYQKHSFPVFGEASPTQVEARLYLWVDANDSESYESLDSSNLEKVILYSDSHYDEFRFRAGLLEETWGEAAAISILDVVNVRDVNHPGGYYSPEAKKPQPMAVLDYFFGESSAQFIYIPFSAEVPAPKEVGDFKVVKRTKYRTSGAPEYGLRLTSLFDATDFSLYYMKHGPRFPSFELGAYSGGIGDLELVEDLEDTIGTSASYAGFNWLLRADIAHHRNVTAINISTKSEKSTLNQAILGYSMTSSALDNYAIELHVDHWGKAPAALEQGAWVTPNEGADLFYWMAFNANANFLNDRLETALVLFRGLNNDDRLISAISSYNYSNEIVVAARFQKTLTGDRSPKSLFGKQETVALSLGYSF